MVADSELQRIARLTPLADVLNGFQTSIAPVEPREEALAAALGKTLAADVSIAQARPAKALALRDGFALRADLTTDASSYAPAPLSPSAVRVEIGDALPEGADAVAALDAVTARGEATAPVAPGEGVLPAGGDAAPGVLRLSGARLRRVDVALMQTLGIERVLIREPHVRVTRTRDALDAAARLVANAIEAEGSTAIADSMTLDAALKAAMPTPSSPSAAPAVAAAMQASARWRGSAASSTTASLSPPARPPRSASSARVPCCCCPDGLMRRWPAGSPSDGGCWRGSPSA